MLLISSHHGVVLESINWIFLHEAKPEDVLQKTTECSPTGREYAVRGIRLELAQSEAPAMCIV